MDVPTLQKLTTDLYVATGIPSAIIDMEGEVLTGAGWQRVCTDFHRKHPDIERDCIASDIAIREGIEAGDEFVIYECPRGLVDACSPVVIEGEHVANVFAGQLFMTPPDDAREAFFRESARKYGIDEEAYLGAYREIPVMPEDKFRPALTFLSELAKLIASIGLARLREVEAAARARTDEERLETILRTAMDGLLILDVEANILEANEAACNIFGYSREELQKMAISDLDVDLSKDDIADLNKRLVAVGRARFEGRHRRRDGAVIDVEVSIQHQATDGGRFISFLRDITDRKRAEDQLSESVSRYKAFFEHGPDGVVVLDTATARILEFNDRACEQLGFSREEFGLLSVPDIEVLESREQTRERIQQIMREGYGEFQTQQRTKQGEVRDVHVIAEMIKLGGRDIYHCVWRDITEQKRAEEERERLQSRLAQSQKMEAIGTLAGGIAHDFNNILGAIMGYTELSVGELPQGDPVRENLQEVIVASVRAKELVQQILAFGRKGEKKVVSVDSGLLVSEAMKLLVSVIPKTISIERDIDPAAGHVLADPTELHQVVMNLCTNAYQAMPGESGLLRIRLTSVSIDKLEASSIQGLSPGEYVRLDVMDDGSGMDQDTLSRIFEPYFTTKAAGKGTGLGLALVHGIVTALGGAIAVRSTPGIGTSFSIYLPKAEPIRAEAADSKDIASLHGMGSVLVVDDEPSLARLAAKMLESLGYKARVVTDPLEALRVFESDPAGFDAIVTDQTMPGMTGADLVRRAKAVRPGIAAVMCTGYSDLIDESGAKEIGIAAYLQKPYDRNCLGSAVAVALGKEG